MARPTNKTQLLDKARKEYDKLETYLSNLAPEQIAAENVPQKSLRDILAHLYEWQSMFFGWYEGGLCGETPAVPATGYNWGQLPALNQVIYEKYKHLSLDETLSMFRASHQKTIKFIEGLSDEELTIPGLYPWMNRNTLLAYLNSTTGSHYVWAVKEAKKYT